jgi:hypothetical protein
MALQFEPGSCASRQINNLAIDGFRSGDKLGVGGRAGVFLCSCAADQSAGRSIAQGFGIDTYARARLIRRRRAQYLAKTEPQYVGA